MSRPVQWKIAEPRSLFYRPGDTHTFVGRTYVWMWNDTDGFLRRHARWDTDWVPQIIRLRRRPENTLKLVRKMSSMKWGRKREYKWHNPKGHRPRDEVRVYDPAWMSLTDLDLVYRDV